jgi:hypothetical protein
VHLSSRGSACADTSEPDADREYDAAADDDLHDGAGKLATHEAVTNESDCEELTYNHHISQLERDNPDSESGMGGYGACRLDLWRSPLLHHVAAGCRDR